MPLGTLFTAEISPPARAIHLLEAALGIQLEHVEMDLLAGQQLKPEFIKLNPQHTVPLYVDQDKTKIWDSHAIMTYLVSKYAKDDSLYPKDLAKRSLVEQRLHFDSEKVFGALRPIFYPMKLGDKGPLQRQILTVQETYDFMDAFLEGHKWIAGDNLTIADFSLVTSVTALNHLIPIDAAKHKKLLAWIDRCKKLPYYEERSGRGDAIFKEFAQTIMRQVNQK